MIRIRTDKLLANLGYGSRKEVQKLVKKGLVTLDGNILSEPEERLVLNETLRGRLSVEGEALDPLPGLVLIMHKPAGVTCSRKEEEGKIVFDLLPPRWKQRDPALCTVGRLDKESTGLLLLTDDGALLHRLISPKGHVPKCYRVKLDRPLQGNEEKKFASGTMMLESEKKPLLPAKLEALSPTEALVTLSEGRYHQVRRMFAALGNHVLGLKRESMGGLVLPSDLAAGEFREATRTEIEKLFS